MCVSNAIVMASGTITDIDYAVVTKHDAESIAASVFGPDVSVTAANGTGTLASGVFTSTPTQTPNLRHFLRGKARVVEQKLARAFVEAPNPIRYILAFSVHTNIDVLAEIHQRVTIIGAHASRHTDRTVGHTPSSMTEVRKWVTHEYEAPVECNIGSLKSKHGLKIFQAMILAQAAAMNRKLDDNAWREFMNATPLIQTQEQKLVSVAMKMDSLAYKAHLFASECSRSMVLQKEPNGLQTMISRIHEVRRAIRQYPPGLKPVLVLPEAVFAREQLKTERTDYNVTGKTGSPLKLTMDSFHDDTTDTKIMFYSPGPEDERAFEYKTRDGASFMHTTEPFTLYYPFSPECMSNGALIISITDLDNSSLTPLSMTVEAMGAYFTSDTELDEHLIVAIAEFYDSGFRTITSSTLEKIIDHISTDKNNQYRDKILRRVAGDNVAVELIAVRPDLRINFATAVYAFAPGERTGSMGMFASSARLETHQITRVSIVQIVSTFGVIIKECDYSVKIPRVVSCGIAAHGSTQIADMLQDHNVKTHDLVFTLKLKNTKPENGEIMHDPLVMACHSKVGPLRKYYTRQGVANVSQFWAMGRVYSAHGANVLQKGNNILTPFDCPEYTGVIKGYVCCLLQYFILRISDFVFCRHTVYNPARTAAAYH